MKFPFAATLLFLVGQVKHMAAQLTVFGCGGLPGSYNNLDEVFQLMEEKEVNWRTIEHFTCNDLTGTIPPQLYQMTALRSITSYLNELTGTISPEISNLQNLSSLQINNNQFEGTIPTELWSLPALTFITLNNNQFSGTISPEISNLEQATFLSLDRNNFEGSLPESIWTLTSLEHLDVSYNRLTGTLETQKSLLSNLDFLDVSYNGLTGTLPSDLFLNSPESAFLNFWGNPFTGVMPNAGPDPFYMSPEPGEEFFTVITCSESDGTTRTLDEAIAYDQAAVNRLSKAMYIRCENANLTGTVPGFLGDIQTLADLSLGRNKLTGPIPSSLGKASSLVYLDLDENQLTGTIPQEIAGLSNLEILILSSNILSSSIPTELARLSLLRDLDLSNNQLTGLVPKALESLTNLENLELSSNELKGRFPNIFSDMENLESVRVLPNNFRGRMPKFQARSSDVSPGEFIGGVSSKTVYLLSGLLPLGVIIILYLKFRPDPMAEFWKTDYGRKSGGKGDAHIEKIVKIDGSVAAAQDEVVAKESTEVKDGPSL